MSTERSKGKKSIISTGQPKPTRNYGQMYRTLNGILIKLETCLSSSGGILIVSDIPQVELPKGPTWALIYVLTFLQGCVGTIISILSQAVLLNDEFGLESVSLNDKSEPTIEMLSNQVKPISRKPGTPELERVTTLSLSTGNVNSKPLATVQYVAGLDNKPSRTKIQDYDTNSLKNSSRWKLDTRRILQRMEKIQDRGEALRASVHVSRLGRPESQLSQLKYPHSSVDLRPSPFLKRVPETKSFLKSRKEETCRPNLSTQSARCKPILKQSKTISWPHGNHSRTASQDTFEAQPHRSVSSSERPSPCLTILPSISSRESTLESPVPEQSTQQTIYQKTNFSKPSHHWPLPIIKIQHEEEEQPWSSSPRFSTSSSEASDYSQVFGCLFDEQSSRGQSESTLLPTSRATVSLPIQSPIFSSFQNSRFGIMPPSLPISSISSQDTLLEDHEEHSKHCLSPLPIVSMAKEGECSAIERNSLLSGERHSSLNSCNQTSLRDSLGEVSVGSSMPLYRDEHDDAKTPVAPQVSYSHFRRMRGNAMTVISAKIQACLKHRRYHDSNVFDSI